MIGVAVVSFVLLATVVYLIAKPLLAPAGGAAATTRLVEERGRVLVQVGDLDMEFQTGKLDEGEYLATRGRRLAEVQGIDLAIEEAERSQETGPIADSSNGRPAVEADDDLERAIAARKREIESHGCPSCNTRIDPDDAFCRSCGAGLTTALGCEVDP